MNESPEERAAASTRTLEVVVALAMLAIGSLVMWDSARIGASWGSDGPQSGYFPFYIGLLMNAASMMNLWRGWRVDKSDAFVSRAEWRRVLVVLLPMVAYVAVLQWTGIYLASAIFIAIFMRWQGQFGWLSSWATGVGTAVVLFCMFELWFMVPLIKGPIESALGY